MEDNNLSYLDTWWAEKVETSYGIQAKHFAAAELISGASFPLLDLGAGIGVFLKHLEEQFPGAVLEGLELSGTAIANRICDSHIAHGDLTSWKCEKALRTASLIDVIEHLHNPELLLRHLAERSSRILVVCPNFNFVKARWDMLLGRIPFQNKAKRGGHVFWCQYENLCELFSKCGLQIEAENHLYPRNHISWLKRLFDTLPSFWAHEFVFLLKAR